MPEEEAMGEVVDEEGAPPPGFSLEAETSRVDPVSPGIVERTVEPEPEDEELPEIIERRRASLRAEADLDVVEESGYADAGDDEVIEDPDDASPIEDI